MSLTPDSGFIFLFAWTACCTPETHSYPNLTSTHHSLAFPRIHPPLCSDAIIVSPFGAVALRCLVALAGSRAVSPELLAAWGLRHGTSGAATSKISLWSTPSFDFCPVCKVLAELQSSRHHNSKASDCLPAPVTDSPYPGGQTFMYYMNWTSATPPSMSDVVLPAASTKKHTAGVVSQGTML